MSSANDEASAYEQCEALLQGLKALAGNAAFAALMARVQALYEQEAGLHEDVRKSAAENREHLASKLILRELRDWPAAEEGKARASLKKMHERQNSR